jgi:acetolactate synthase-1/3 small subunit
MRHIISILLQNEAGALGRVAGLFSSRGYNIESLSVAPTQNPLISRLTLVTLGSDSVIEQINKQLRRLIDVVEVSDLSSHDHLECELLMLKVAVDTTSARHVVECVRHHRGQILDESENTRTVQFAGTAQEIETFLVELGKLAPVLELVRSGVAALQRGHTYLAMPVL